MDARGNLARLGLLGIAVGQASLLFAYLYAWWSGNDGYYSTVTMLKMALWDQIGLVGTLGLVVTIAVMVAAGVSCLIGGRSTRTLAIVLGGVAGVVAVYWIVKSPDGWSIWDVWEYMSWDNRILSAGSLLLASVTALLGIVAGAMTPRPPATPPTRPSPAYATGGPVGYAAQGGQSYGGSPVMYAQGAEPSVAATVVVTFFFGLFGLIPASIHSGRANRAGLSGRKYWVAFGVTMGAQVLFWGALTVAFYVWLIAAANDSTYNY